MDEGEEKSFYRDYNKHVKSRGMTLSKSRTELHKLSRPIAKERYELLKKNFLKNDKVLEIGSSTGAFLENLKKQKGIKDLSSVEPCLVNRNYCKRFSKNAYDDISQIDSEQKYNKIVMFHVFEHMKKPFTFLEQCKRHLKRGGLLIVEVPFIEDPLISLYNCRAYKDFYFQPMHPFVYSLKSLRYVLLKSGFKKKKIIYYQRYGLSNHLTWLTRGIPGGDKKLNKIFSNTGYRQTLEKAKKTDTIFYIAKKN